MISESYNDKRNNKRFYFSDLKKTTSEFSFSSFQEFFITFIIL